jgi:hypothetical protein
MTGTTIPTFPIIVSTTETTPIAAMSTATTAMNIVTGAKTIGTITRSIVTTARNNDRSAEEVAIRLSLQAY